MNWINDLPQLFGDRVIPMSVTIGLIILWIILRSLLVRLIKNHSLRTAIAPERQLYIRKLVKIILLLVVLSALGAIWEISIQGLSLYFASIFTVVGVALFATWSILSNLTASIVLFFFFPYRIGHHIKIIDGDNSIEGRILDITFFYIKIETKKGLKVTYPNNLALQKPIQTS